MVWKNWLNLPLNSFGTWLINDPYDIMKLTDSIFFYLFALTFVPTFFSCQPNDTHPRPDGLIGYVNPFIGTGGHGHTFPGATVPFGMVQLSPDTRLTGWDGCSGYHYTDDVIYGFSHTHLSGTGISDYADVLLMPTVGQAFFNNGADGMPGYSSHFQKENEYAHPGYYSVLLDESNVKVELTSTKRAGLHKYKFPETKEANVMLDLVHRDQVTDAFVRVVGNNTLEGYRHSSGWAKDQRVFFVIEFSQPFGQWGLADEKRDIRLDSLRNKHIKAFFRFDVSSGEPLLARVGISAVSIDGARKNLKAEIDHWDFNKVKTDAEAEWEKVLSKIEVKGGSDDKKTVFYTSIYHNYMAPNLYSDVDGKYRGMDRNVHQLTDDEHYTIFSLWDTYRATHPLYAILEEDRTSAFIRTFLRQYDEGGILPIWELAGNYTGTMIGYHAIPAIADAYVKGVREYDIDKAYEAMRHSAMQDHLGLESYKKWGFVASDKESESVSKTLEYAYDDWCIAQMAKMLGKDDDYQYFIKRAQAYKNVYDPFTKFMRARVNHQWFGPFDPSEVNFHYTEANSWQYSFYVPQDVSGLIAAMGGDDALEKQLDALFQADEATTGRIQPDISGLIGQYAHGNEPSHHMAYLYNYIGKPDKTAHYIHRIMNELYSNAPDGLSGNEDCGQMSAWLVFSAMGFYPVTPASPDYIIGSPWFKEITINIKDGKTFKIKAEGLSDQNIFIQSAQLNGQPYNRSAFDHNTLLAGGELIFKMGAERNSEWGTANEARPVSEIKEFLIVPTPVVTSGLTSFVDSTELTLSCLNPEVNAIYYTLDQGSGKGAFSLYEGPISLKDNAVLYAYAQNENQEKSPEIQVSLKKIPGGRSIELKTEYANQYNAGGNNGLIDFKRAGEDFRTGGWQGYEGIDLDAVVDLGESQTIKKVALSCLQDQNSWIFMPEKVEFFVGDEKDNLKKVGEVANMIGEKEDGAILRDFSLEINKRVKYIGIIARNRKTVPEWHKGAGGKSWVFADEIIIE
ncbi:MAG: GH92 family glycosyl hydrolase [Bacteroidota bacterium]